MANHKSAQKRTRQSLRRRDRNRGRKSAVRTLEKAARQAAEAGDGEAATQRLREAEGALRRAATKGVLSKAQASRRVSRLARRVHRAGQ